jgi:hypothetical protein
MRKFALLTSLLAVLLCNIAYSQIKKQPAIGLFDLDFTMQWQGGDQQAISRAWDYAHTLASLQGIVNRTTPQLYVLLVKNGNADIDRYWWNKYRTPGKWLAGRDTGLYKNIVDVISAYKKQIKVR